MKTIKVSREEFDKLKKEYEALSDEELNKVAGGWCEPGCIPQGTITCMCPDDWWENY